MQKQSLIILTGPTAVGKTKASIGLAKAIGGEIISADPCRSTNIWILVPQKSVRKKCSMFHIT